MSELEELQDLVGNIDEIDTFGIEPDFSSLGLEQADVLGFANEEDLEKAIKFLTLDINKNSLCLIYSL